MRNDTPNFKILDIVFGCDDEKISAKTTPRRTPAQLIESCQGLSEPDLSKSLDFLKKEKKEKKLESFKIFYGKKIDKISSKELSLAYFSHYEKL